LCNLKVFILIKIRLGLKICVITNCFIVETITASCAGEYGPRVPSSGHVLISSTAVPVPPVRERPRTWPGSSRSPLTDLKMQTPVFLLFLLLCAGKSACLSPLPLLPYTSRPYRLCLDLVKTQFVSFSPLLSLIQKL